MQKYNKFLFLWCIFCFLGYIKLFLFVFLPIFTWNYTHFFLKHLRKIFRITEAYSECNACQRFISIP